MNRFTRIFNEPIGDTRDGVFYISLVPTLETDCKFPSKFTIDILDNTVGETGESWAEWKLTFISFLSHMTDKELNEIVGI